MRLARALVSSPTSMSLPLPLSRTFRGRLCLTYSFIYTHTHTHTHARAHARTHTHTHYRLEDVQRVSSGAYVHPPVYLSGYNHLLKSRMRRLLAGVDILRHATTAALLESCFYSCGRRCTAPTYMRVPRSLSVSHSLSRARAQTHTNTLARERTALLLSRVATRVDDGGGNEEKEERAAVSSFFLSLSLSLSGSFCVFPSTALSLVCRTTTAVAAALRESLCLVLCCIL